MPGKEYAEAIEDPKQGRKTPTLSQGLTKRGKTLRKVMHAPDTEGKSGLRLPNISTHFNANFTRKFSRRLPCTWTHVTGSPMTTELAASGTRPPATGKPAATFSKSMTTPPASRLSAFPSRLPRHVRAGGLGGPAGDSPRLVAEFCSRPEELSAGIAATEPPAP